MRDINWTIVIVSLVTGVTINLVVNSILEYLKHIKISKMIENLKNNMGKIEVEVTEEDSNEE